MTNTTYSSDLAPVSNNLRSIAVWLFIMASLIALMVVVGGLTRLTDSGLSITEWKPVTGAIPPLSAADWDVEFAKYQASPEYQLQNTGMALAEFKSIFWWEWGHRLLGRFIGIAFAVPLLYFLITRQATGRRAVWLIFLLLLGGAQGFVGWLMVASGLEDGMTDVSHYRLAAHLGLAVLIYGFVLWTALTYSRNTRVSHRRAGAGMALLFVGLVFAQICAGAFVAGLDAGIVNTTWPLIDGALVPEGLDWTWRGFEDRLTVQFMHRMLAYGCVLFALILWPSARRVAPAAANWVLIIVLAQTALGITVLTSAASLTHIWMAAAHQLGALVLFTAAIVLLTCLRPSAV